MGLERHKIATAAAYDDNVEAWVGRTARQRLDVAEALRATVDGPILDLGCGPGWHLPALAPAIGVDLSYAMARLAQEHGPVVRADMSALPFARAAFAGVWASRSLVHLPRSQVPAALAELHRVLAVDAMAKVWVFEGDSEGAVSDADRLPGRMFSYWAQGLLRDVFTGAGFAFEAFETWHVERFDEGQIMVSARRLWTLPDTVGPGMKLLICGLNPSPDSADHGVGFHRAGNRFWPAALQAGVVTRDRDPRHALGHHGVGMTDLVKRPTRRADELTTDEYRSGLERLRRLVDWLRPEAICMVGLAGWRAAADRKAGRGWQPEPLGDCPVYVMPSTSGLNAHDTVDSLADHLRAALAGP